MVTTRRLLAALLSALMLVGSLSGCGTQAGTSSTKQPTKLVMDWPVMMGVPKDWPAVQEAINKITLQKINATVKINLLDMSAYHTQFNMLMAGGQGVDIVNVGTVPTDTFTGPATKGEFMPLDNLLNQYGQGIKQAVDPAFLGCGRINGTQYAIPLLESWAEQNGFTVRSDLVAKYHIDLSKVKEPQDMGAVFQVIKNHKPTMYPLYASGMYTVISCLRWYDRLGDGIGVLPNFDNKLKVVDLYETPEYARMLKMVRTWYLKGYINPDAATSPQNPMHSLGSGRSFTIPGGGMPGFTEMFKATSGVSVISVPIGRPFITTSDVAFSMYAIPRSSLHPKEAMKFLNLLYTNKDIINLLAHGIKGKDYTMASDNSITYPPGLKPSDKYPGVSVGNSYLSYLLTSQSPNLHQETASFNNNALKSKALGFNWNPNPVKTQYAAVMNVLAQYKTALQNGTMDPTTTLPVFIAKLKAAGIDKIIAEKQKQLDRWAASNHVKD